MKKVFELNLANYQYKRKLITDIRDYLINASELYTPNNDGLITAPNINDACILTSDDSSNIMFSSANSSKVNFTIASNSLFILGYYANENRLVIFNHKYSLSPMKFFSLSLLPIKHLEIILKEVKQFTDQLDLSKTTR